MDKIMHKGESAFPFKKVKYISLKSVIQAPLNEK